MVRHAMVMVPSRRCLWLNGMRSARSNMIGMMKNMMVSRISSACSATAVSFMSIRYMPSGAVYYRVFERACSVTPSCRSVMMSTL